MIGLNHYREDSMNNKRYILYAIILIMGMITASINLANGLLADHIGLLESVVVIHIIGLIMSILYYLILEKNKKEKTLGIIKTKPYLILGGLLGSVAVVSVSFTILKIGVLLMSTAMIAGQFIFSFVIDAKGLFGFEKVPLTKKKILSIIIMLVGITLLTI